MLKNVPSSTQAEEDELAWENRGGTEEGEECPSNATSSSLQRYYPSYHHMLGVVKLPQPLERP